MAPKVFAPILADNTAQDNYDSRLELPSGTNPPRNARLTLTLKVKLNFVNETTKGLEPKVARHKDGRTYAMDARGWLFPIMDWDNETLVAFQKGYVEQAMKVWNNQFLLMPQGYSGVDIEVPAQPIRTVMRPNVDCLFELKLVESGYHRLIHVFLLDKLVMSVTNADPAKNKTPREKPVKDFTAQTWRSDETDLDDSDLFNPYWIDLTNEQGKVERVVHDTIGHEIGHALGQPHILGLKGEPKFQDGGEREDDDEGYGRTLEEKANIMGHGNQVTLLNAVSWTRRLFRHTGTSVKDWLVTKKVGLAPVYLLRPQ